MHIVRLFEVHVKKTEFSVFFDDWCIDLMTYRQAQNKVHTVLEITIKTFN